VRIFFTIIKGAPSARRADGLNVSSEERARAIEGE